LGFVVFIDQGFELVQVAVEFGSGKGRGEVVDNHGLGAALGLGTLTGVIHNEGVKVGQCAKGHFGIALVR